MSFKGHFLPRNPAKYAGDYHAIIYRSLWERNVFKWCDTCEDVVQWSSETTIVPYISKVDGKQHRYFVDLKIRFKNGATILVEIKPKRQTMPPQKKSRITKGYLAEVLTWATNTSKWEAADKYARSRGFEFQVWTEERLKSLGIMVL